MTVVISTRMIVHTRGARLRSEDFAVVVSASRLPRRGGPGHRPVDRGVLVPRDEDAGVCMRDGWRVTEMLRTTARGSRASDLVYAGIALVAGALTNVGQWFNPLVVIAVAAALVPWVLTAVGVRMPHPLFAALAIVPIIPVAVLTGIGAALFMILTPASRVASRSDSRWLIAVLTGVVIVMPLPFALLGESEWDVGSVYFALGGAFSVLLGVSLRRSTRLAEELRRADAELLQAAARG